MSPASNLDNVITIHPAPMSILYRKYSRCKIEISSYVQQLSHIWIGLICELTWTGFESEIHLDCVRLHTSVWCLLSTWSSDAIFYFITLSFCFSLPKFWSHHTSIPEYSYRYDVYTCQRYEIMEKHRRVVSPSHSLRSILAFPDAQACSYNLPVLTSFLECGEVGPSPEPVTSASPVLVQVKASHLRSGTYSVLMYTSNLLVFLRFVF